MKNTLPVPLLSITKPPLIKTGAFILRNTKFLHHLSDLISRVILAPSEISVGIITSLIGAPYFIYLIIKIRKEGKRL